ncbi:GNAT family protein [Saccharibacillus sp. CPCC 101409]|uniref:GNAT family N-acetyltransferase n=1 Tax=Saccharibacillus sp. CPCC 101409 TaxID=3058041 RepID=UPI002670EC9C|nr:GNAT family protein [Saccharibacillus sp. CPCC 101409]MDO3410763.1 GNAT family protein [Saccharibacillus sp. CPCC 101409]
MNRSEFATTVLEGGQVRLRSVTPTDYEELYALQYTIEDREWTEWDGPYYKDEEHEETCTEFVENYERIKARNLPWEPRLLVETKEGETLGVVTSYWEHKPSNWLEAGILLYRSTTWSRGSGTEALRLYVDYLFAHLDVPRVGITTWSGNARMMRAAERIGMQLEGRMRRCRIVRGELYDSIRMGVLREEWEERYGGIGGMGQSESR